MSILQVKVGRPRIISRRTNDVGGMTPIPHRFVGDRTGNYCSVCGLHERPIHHGKTCVMATRMRALLEGKLEV